MSTARDTILGKVRSALGKQRTDEASLAQAQAYIDAHAQGPRPSLPGDLVSRFVQRAGDMESTVERVADRDEIPRAISRYLDGVESSPGARERFRKGVCWPEFADLDWAGAGLAIESRPTSGDDVLGITGVFCAI